MGQIVGAIRGMAEACRALEYPVVSGNVSLYNDTHGASIQPTPAVGGLGVIADVTRRGTVGFNTVGDAILLIGETAGHLGSSLYLREILGREDGAPPPVNLAHEKRNGDAVRALVLDGLASACHDIADGGLLVALTEMCFPHSIGAQISIPDYLPAHAFLFGEDQSRYLISVRAEMKDLVLFRLNALDVPVFELGATIADDLVVEDITRAPISRLRDINSLWLPGYMSDGE
jgi:phosphoribosylformylglycinamidine synthase